MSDDKRTRLIREAHRLKCAWLLAAAVIGVGKQLTEKDLTIPNYFAYEKKWLKRHIEDMKDDFEVLAKEMLLDWKLGNLNSTTAWMEQKFNAWQQARLRLFELGRVHEMEETIGQLGHRRFMDCPPYAQVLLQGFHGAAIRHPEYHLATDLALLYGLYLDSEAINDESQRQRKVHSSEHSQSLGRSVILTCFNLLESFASGIAAAHLIVHSDISEEVANQLKGRKPNGRDYSLREKFVLYPSLIASKPKLDDNQTPLKELFGACKQRRDSFVHCEPGPQQTKWGYVKEQRFHDVDRANVQKTVELTCDAICLVWKTVHRKDKPSWLPNRNAEGRFVRAVTGLRLAEATA